MALRTVNATTPRNRRYSPPAPDRIAGFEARAVEKRKQLVQYSLTMPWWSNEYKHRWQPDPTFEQLREEFLAALLDWERALQLDVRWEHYDDA
jgi:hypothetical protein